MNCQFDVAIPNKKCFIFKITSKSTFPGYLALDKDFI